MIKNKVKYLDINLIGRDVIFGDVHGCYADLQLLLKNINFDYKNDRLLSVGDLIDRGPDSESCLSLIKMPWFHCVYANHEQMAVEGLIGKDQNMLDSWMYNGGQWYNSSDKDDVQNLCEYIIEHIPYIIVIGKDTTKRVNIVHAELTTNKELSEFATDNDIDTWNFNTHNTDNMLWGRKFSENRHHYKDNPLKTNPGLSTTYCGHTPTEKPFEVMNHRYIDTGAVFSHTRNLNRTLTCVDITNDIVHQLNTKTGEFKSDPSREYFK